MLGIWIEQNEGAKFWLKVMNELRNRGVEDILIAVVDGLKGFPEAITTVFPLASVQTCIVHLSRYCLSFCGWKERQPVARELKAIYRAETAEAAAKRLTEFEAGPWARKYPMIAESWRRNWEQIIPFYGFAPEVRKIIYTTNAIESLHNPAARGNCWAPTARGKIEANRRKTKPTLNTKLPILPGTAMMGFYRTSSPALQSKHDHKLGLEV